MGVRQKPEPNTTAHLPTWALGALIALVVILLAATSYWLFTTIEGLVSAADVDGPDFSGVTEPDPAPASNGDNAAPTQAVDSPPAITTDALKPWPGRERVNLLLLGIDQRCEEEGPTRTDTMMVLTIDPVSLSAAALSLPRDLWVEIPGFGVDRINQAHYLGEIYDYPEAGPGLAVETVEATLGITVDYFVTVNFEAVIEGVDLIGGIDLFVAETIDDLTYPDNCYGYDPFHMEAGRQHLDGATALKYARTRATFGGDIDRAARQQDVILAIRDRVLRLNMIPTLLTQAPELWQTFRQNVNTDLTPDEAIQLALLAQEIPQANIRTAVLDYNYVYNETTPDGQQVLAPIRDNIRALRDELFAPPPVPTPVVEALPQLMAVENARVALYNGTPVFGLAGATQEYLLGLNVNVTEIGNADSAEIRTTQIIDFGSHPNTTLYLARLLDVPPLNVSSSSQPSGDFDVLVILGGGWEVPEP